MTKNDEVWQPLSREEVIKGIERRNPSRIPLVRAKWWDEGIDVLHVLQEKDPDGVRAEIRFLIDTFDQPGGGMCIAAGNGIVAGTPFENIQAFLDEAVQYGSQHRKIVAP